MAAILARIAELVLEWFYQKVAVAIHDYVVRREAQKAIEERNRQAREQTDAAKTKEERDAAADNIRNRLGG